MNIIPIIAAEITDETLWKALAGMAAFVGALVWWILKDLKYQRDSTKKQEKERMSLEKDKLIAQVDMNHSLDKLAEALKEHMEEENDRSISMKESIDKLCTTNEKLTDTITKTFLKEAG